MPLGDVTARGFVYTLMQVGGVKAFNFLAQIALSWLLDSKAFGYVSLAYLVSSFAGLIGQASLREVLIQRWKRFDTWSTPAFWLSLTLGASSMLLMIGFAPIAGHIFHDRRLVWLIIVLSLQNVFVSASLVPQARLNIDLRFKALTVINFINSVSLTSLTVIFAGIAKYVARDPQTLNMLGAYAFILPWPITAIVRCILLWKVSKQRVRLWPSIQLWPKILKDCGMLIAGAFFLMITWQGDYLLLGWMCPDKQVVGRYYWAFNLSTQALQVLAVNVASVLLPSLARMQDEPERLLRAFLRAMKSLLVLAVPACLLQAALADSLIRVVFKSEWYPAIVIVQILSVGWTVFVVRHPSDALLWAQGRFATSLKLLIAGACIFLPCVYVGARFGTHWSLGPAAGVAVGVGVYSMLFAPVSLYVVIKKLGGNVRTVARVLVAPTLAGLISTGLAVEAGRQVPVGAKWTYLARAAVIGSVTIAVYVPLIRFLARDAYDELAQHLRNLLKRGSAKIKEKASVPI